MKIVGLTGGIATGKSLITKWFKEDHIPVIDADIVYKDLSKPSHLLYNTIIHTFGRDILNGEEIDFHKLGLRVFSDERTRNKLNEITHPIVKKEILRQLDLLQDEELVIVSVPLLFESHFNLLCDEVICVYAKESVELKRLMARDGIDESYARQKIETQMPLDEKAKLSTYIIDNSYGEEETRSSYEKILKRL